MQHGRDEGTEMLEQFVVALYEFVYDPTETIRLPGFKGNPLRGGFGYAFKKMVCVTGASSPCATCQLKSQCPYAYLFETPLPEGAQVLRLNERVPHPFVLRPPLDAHDTYDIGERFPFGVVLIGHAIQYLPYFVIAFQQLGRQGIGARRGKAALSEVTGVNPLDSSRTQLYSNGVPTSPAREVRVTWAQLAQQTVSRKLERVSVEFLTPTRLKHGEELVKAEVEFHVLIRALLRRVSSLAYFHCGRRWETDYRGLIERATTVRLLESQTRWLDQERYSTRQKTRMNLGGVVGTATYAGDALCEFLPLLALGELVHVGKACVFGNGWYRITYL